VRRALALLAAAAIMLLGSSSPCREASAVTPEEKASSAVIEEETVSTDAEKIDWQALRQENPDTAGWITVPGTCIDFPVVRGEDDTEYLRKAFDGTYSVWGTPFFSSSSGPESRNLIMYGHSGPGGRMFGELEDYAAAEDRREPVLLCLPEGDFECRLISIFRTDMSLLSWHGWQVDSFPDEADERTFFFTAEELSCVDSSVPFLPGSRYLTIQTCSFDSDGNNDGRLVAIFLMKPYG
jgi:sortase B